MVVLVDDGDGARVQVDPEEVWPHLHAALQLVALLDPSQLAVHSINTQRSCWNKALTDRSLLYNQNQFSHMNKDGFSKCFSYLSTEAWNQSKNLLQPGSPLSGDENMEEDKTSNLILNIASTKAQLYNTIMKELEQSNNN